MAATQSFWARRPVKVQIKKVNLSYFVQVFLKKTADFLRFSGTVISRVYREWSQKKEQAARPLTSRKNCFLDVRGQIKWPDCFGLKPRQL